MKLTHFSLFSGIGGIDLAAEWAGFETIGQCEWADYPTKVLEKHWPDVPRWRDIRSVTAESFREKTGLQTVDLISGGFPCQPFSVAGNQKGKRDDRYLWPEMLRIIRELAPRWVLGENVPGIIKIAGKTVCEDLEREGYAIAVFNFEAAAVGAPHRRERVFFIGERIMENACDIGCKQSKVLLQQQGGAEFVCSGKTCTNGAAAEMSANVANTESWGIKREFADGNKAWGFSSGSWWSTEPNVGRVANGVPNRVHRLKCLGNAVVPQQVYPILKAITDIERNGA